MLVLVYFLKTISLVVPRVINSTVDASQYSHWAIRETAFVNLGLNFIQPSRYIPIGTRECSNNSPRIGRAPRNVIGGIVRINNGYAIPVLIYKLRYVILRSMVRRRRSNLAAEENSLCSLAGEGLIGLPHSQNQILLHNDGKMSKAAHRDGPD